MTSEAEQETTMRRSSRKRVRPVTLVEESYQGGTNQVEEEEENQSTVDNVEIDDIFPDSRKKSKKRSKRKSSSPKRKKKVAKDQSIILDQAEEREYSEMMTALLSTSSAMYSVVMEWIQVIQKNEMEALRQFLTLLFELANANHLDALSSVDTLDPQDIIEQISSQTTHLVDSYLLAGKQSKKIIANMKKFIKALMEALNSSLLFDGEIFSLLLEWLKRLALSKRKSFRHTATQITYLMMNELIRLSLAEEKHLTTTQTQLSEEKKRNKAGRNQQKIKQLKQAYKEADKRISALASYMKTIVEQIFVHRYRDVHVEIRHLSVESLGTWMLTFSPFVDNEYLKYIGWSFNDSEAIVRRCALESITKLVENPAYQSSLVDFLKRFVPRIDEMLRDKDSSVICSALECFQTLLKHGVASPDQWQDVAPMLWDSNSNVRKAVSHFIYEETFATDDRSDFLDQFFTIYEECAPKSQEMMTCVQLLVDLFWDQVPELSNWKTLHDLAQSPPSAEEWTQEKVRHFQSFCLAVILASIQRASSNLPSQITHTRRVSSEIKQRQEKAVEQFEQYFAETLIELIPMFQAESQSLSYVVQLPMFLSHEHEELSGILELLQKLFRKVVDPQALQGIALTYIHFSKNEAHSAIGETTQYQITTMAEEIWSQIDQHISEEDENETSLTNEELGCSCLRLYVLMCAFSPISQQITLEKCHKLVKYYLTQPHEAYPLEQVFRLFCISLIYEIDGLHSRQPETDQVDLTRSFMYCRQLMEALFEMKDVTLTDNAIGIYCDVLVLSGAVDQDSFSTLFSDDLTAHFVTHGVSRCDQFLNYDIEQDEEIRKRSVVLESYGKLCYQAFDVFESVLQKILSLVVIENDVLARIVKSIESFLRKTDAQKLVQAHMKMLQTLGMSFSMETAHDVAKRVVLSYGLHRDHISFETVIESGFEWMCENLVQRKEFGGQVLTVFIQRCTGGQVVDIVDRLEKIIEQRGLSKRNKALEPVLKVCKKKLKKHQVKQSKETEAEAEASTAQEVQENYEDQMDVEEEEEE